MLKRRSAILQRSRITQASSKNPSVPFVSLLNTQKRFGPNDLCSTGRTTTFCTENKDTWNGWLRKASSQSGLVASKSHRSGTIRGRLNRDDRRSGAERGRSMEHVVSHVHAACAKRASQSKHIMKAAVLALLSLSEVRMDGMVRCIHSGSIHSSPRPYRTALLGSGKQTC